MIGITNIWVGEAREDIVNTGGDEDNEAQETKAEERRAPPCIVCGEFCTTGRQMRRGHGGWVPSLELS